MTVQYYSFHTKGVYPKLSIFRRIVLGVMTRRVGRLVVTECKTIVAGWKKQPNFKVTAKATKDDISVAVVPTGPVAEIWYRVSQGVEGRWIQVRKKHTYRRVGGYKPALRLNRYRPSTQPGGVRGGRGVRLPPTGYRTKVWWPGIRPRLFEETIGEIVYEPFMKLVAYAMKYGLSEAVRQGD